MTSHTFSRSQSASNNTLRPPCPNACSNRSLEAPPDPSDSATYADLESPTEMLDQISKKKRWSVTYCVAPQERSRTSPWVGRIGVHYRCRLLFRSPVIERDGEEEDIRMKLASLALKGLTRRGHISTSADFPRYDTIFKNYLQETGLHGCITCIQPIAVLKGCTWTWTCKILLHGKEISSSREAYRDIAIEKCYKRAGSSFANWPRRIRQENEMDWKLEKNINIFESRTEDNPDDRL